MKQSNVICEENNGLFCYRPLLVDANVAVFIYIEMMNRVSVNTKAAWPANPHYTVGGPCGHVGPFNMSAAE